MEFIRATAVRPRRATRVYLLSTALLLAVGGTAFGHGAAVTNFRAVVASIEPNTAPIDIKVTGGDTLRIENAGSSTLELCESSAADACRAYLRFDKSGVFARRDARLLRDTDLPSQATDDDGWVLVRREPKFFAYHDPRMSIDMRDVADKIDESDKSAQRVDVIEIPFRYDAAEGTATVRMEYVGGRTWISRYGEQALTALAIIAMLTFFMIDRRRRAAASAPVPK